MQDAARIDAAMEALNQAWQAASQDIYQAQQEAGAGGNGSAETEQGPTGEGEDVTDVEYEEVDDNNSK